MQPNRNRSSRHCAPFWTRRGNSERAEFEEVRNQIESKEKASHYRELNLRALKGRDNELAKAIFECTTDDRCSEILCADCARRYRLWLTSELLHLTAHGPPAFVATILLEVVKGPALCKNDPSVLHERVRKRLTRAGIPAAIGGAEASYDTKTNCWTIHLHLLVFDSLERGRARLRQAFRNSDLERAVLCQPLRDPAAQIPYLQKFQTCHRPGESGHRGRARAYPMKPEQIHQLAQWTRGRRFEDFLFVLGLRRRGSRFEPENGFKRALADAQRNVRVRGDGGDGGDSSKRYLRNPTTSSPLRMSSVTVLVLHPPASIPIDCIAIPPQKTQFAKTRSATRATQSLKADPLPSPPIRSAYRFQLRPWQR